MSILKQNENQDNLNEKDVYFNFINSLKSEVTKKEYEREIRLFMKFCNVTKLSGLLIQVTEPQKQIITYITSLKERDYHTIQYHWHCMQFTIYTK
jgi:hypothetical protein